MPEISISHTKGSKHTSPVRGKRPSAMTLDELYEMADFALLACEYHTDRAHDRWAASWYFAATVYIQAIEIRLQEQSRHA